MNKLTELDELDESDDASSTTPVRNDFDRGDMDSVPVSQQPPPLIRAPVPSSARQQRQLDRTRSEMQVEGFLARGIDQLRVGIASISEDRDADNDDFDAADSTLDADDTASQITAVTATSAADVDDAEQERQRILEAAFADDDGADAFDLTPSTDRGVSRGKVPVDRACLDTNRFRGCPVCKSFASEDF